MHIATYSQPTQAILRNEFVILGKRLQEREDNDRLAAAEAILSGNDADAEALIAQIKEISSIRTSILPKLVPMKLFSSETQSDAAPSPTETTGVVLSSHGLRVVINGRQITGTTHAARFANAIQEIGCKRVAELSLTLNYIPLVSKEMHKLAHQRYQMQVERRGEWFIVTHSSTPRKRELLAKICRRLGFRLSIEANLN